MSLTKDNLFSLYGSLDSQQRLKKSIKKVEISFPPNYKNKIHKRKFLLSDNMTASPTLSSYSISSNYDQHRSKLMILFVLMGTGPLFPYNSLISSVHYFTTLHPDSDIISQIAATALLGLLTTTIILTVALGCAKNTPTKKSEKNRITAFLQKLSIRDPQKRIVLGFLIEAILFIVLALIPSPSIFACNLIAFCTGMGDAISQSGLYELAASIDPQYTVAVTLGSALAGFGVNLLKLATTAIFPQDLRYDAMLFFSCTCVVILGCIAALYHTLHILKINGMLPNDDNESLLEMVENLDELSLDNEGQIEEIDEDIPNLEEAPTRSTKSSCNMISFYWKTICMTWKPLVSIFLNFFITLALFPGPISSIVSTTTQGSISFGKSLPIALITIFNLCDCLGRFALSEFRSLSGNSSTVEENETSTQTLSQKILFHTMIELDNNSDKGEKNDAIASYKIHLPNFNCWVLYPSIFRIIFFPLFFFCINAEKFSFFLFSQDLGRVFIVTLFALSNGFIATACFMAGPTMIPKDIKNYEGFRDASSLLLLLFCFVGLTLGGYFALVVDKLFILETLKSGGGQ